MRWVLLVLALATTLAAQAPDPWLTRAQPRVLQTVPYQDPAGRFALEIPKKDWESGAVGLQSIAAFEHKSGQASIVIERQRLRRAMEPEAIGDLFVSLQEEEIKGLEPQALELTLRIIDADGRRVLVAQYRRQGGRNAERIRIYTVPHGLFLYRMVCRVAEAQADRFAAVFGHAAASLTFKEGS